MNESLPTRNQILGRVALRTRTAERRSTAAGGGDAEPTAPDSVRSVEGETPREAARASSGTASTITSLPGGDRRPPPLAMGATPISTSTEASPRTPSARRVLLASTETPRVSASALFPYLFSGFEDRTE